MADSPGTDLLAWHGPAIGLLDLDAFFASVEQHDHPEWRGKPVIVGGDPEHRGVVSTASYEARRYGVHSAMPSATARRLCPQAIWTTGHFDRYREVSRQVMALIQDETPLVEQVSIDEAFFDVTPGRYSRESPLTICRRLQERVARLGVTCSIGLGTNKTVAKVASEMDKPRGLTTVLPGTEARFLAPLPVGRMSGVGHATARRLADMGIHTLGELARADERRMQEEFGVHGPRLVERAAGRERSRVRAAAEHEPVKSVSSERTFAHDLVEEADVRAAVGMVAELCGTRLRRKNLAGTVVTLKLRYGDLSVHTAQQPLAGPTDDEHVFGPAAQELLGVAWHPGVPVRLVGVGISGFDRAGGTQLALDLGQDGQDPGGDRAVARRSADLARATDQIRERFGTGSVSYGRDLRFGGQTTKGTPGESEPGTKPGPRQPRA